MCKKLFAVVMLFVMTVSSIIPTNRASAAEIIPEELEFGTVVIHDEMELEDGTIALIDQLFYADGRTEVYVRENDETYYFEGRTLNLAEGNETVLPMASEIGMPTKTLKYTKYQAYWDAALVAAAIAAGCGVSVKVCKSAATAIFNRFVEPSGNKFFVSVVEQTLVSDGATSYYRASVLTTAYTKGYYNGREGSGVFTYRGSYPI
ncbi:MAG: hypothetical protein IJ744_12625 [Lachnospiraceae bacterium]|nr:hypothetical protein [Lachnospiraceae bacterium]